MDWNRIEGNWKQVKGKIKEQWGQLTDDELDEIAGNRDQLEARSRSATASRGTVYGATSMTGIIARPGIGNSTIHPPTHTGFLLSSIVRTDIGTHTRVCESRVWVAHTSNPVRGGTIAAADSRPT